MSLSSSVTGATWLGRVKPRSGDVVWRSRLASHELSHFSENFGENDLVRGALPNDSSLVDLGQHRLRDVAEMEHVFQLEHPELRSDFPPLTTSSQSRECESGISPPLHQ